MVQGVVESVAEKLCQGEERVTVTASQQTPVIAKQSGYVSNIGAGAVARLAIALGAGRSHPSDTLDLGAGVQLLVEIGDCVKEGDPWAIIHHNKPIPPNLLQELEQCLKLSQDREVVNRITKVY